MNNETLHLDRLEKATAFRKKWERTDKTMIMEPGVFKINKEGMNKYLIFFADNSVIATTTMVEAIEYSIVYVRAMADNFLFSPDDLEYNKLNKIQSELLKARKGLMLDLGGSGKRHIVSI